MPSEAPKPGTPSRGTPEPKPPRACSFSSGVMSDSRFVMRSFGGKVGIPEGRRLRRGRGGHREQPGHCRGEATHRRANQGFHVLLQLCGAIGRLVESTGSAERRLAPSGRSDQPAGPLRSGARRSTPSAARRSLAPELAPQARLSSAAEATSTSLVGATDETDSFPRPFRRREAFLDEGSRRRRRRRPSPAASGRPAENGRRGRDRRFHRRFGLRRHRRHDPRQGARIRARGDVHLQGHSLWSAHLRRPALHGAGEAGALDRRSLCARLGVREPADSARALGQGRGGLRLRMEPRRAGRRLPAPERLDPRPRQPQARRHGLVARRRLRHRLRQRDERLRWREPRTP